MKIGILTIHNAHNYGAMLQAYGTQQTLLSLGHDVSIIHYHPEHIESKNRRKKNVGSVKQLIVRFAELLLAKQFRTRYRNFDSFMEKNFKLTRRYETPEDLFAEPPAFDAYICGSDQIWNMETGGSKVYFLQFVRSGKKISYAPSFGRDHIPEQYEPKLKELLSTFDSISVRESSGVDIIEKACGTAPVQVLDPVFLLPVDQWSAIAEAPNFKGKYLLFYSLEVSAALSSLVEAVSKQLNLPVVILGKGGRFVLKCKTKMAIDSGPAEFLGWFEHASFVITNSFHATAFAIIFRKPFYIVPHSTRNTRMESLLKVAHLESRQVFSAKDIENKTSDYIVSVDYEKTEKSLQIEMDNSINYLKTSLS